MFIVGLFLQSLSFAEVNYPFASVKERFQSSLRPVANYVLQIDMKQSLDDRISSIDSSGVRDSLTELQNLIRVYQDMDCCKQFEPFYDEAKKFEDLISHVRDFKYFYQSAQDESSKQKYKKILDDEVVKYDDFFKTSSWFKKGQESFSNKILAEVDKVQWPSLAEERNMALDVLAKRVSKISKKEFDLNLVEKGIHELKRDLRRLFYLKRGYANLLSDDSLTCPLEGEVQKPTNPIVDKESYTCAISSCLTSKLLNATSALDSIKMSGLQYELQGEPPPAWVKESAQKELDGIKKPRVLELIEAQIRNCITK